MDRLKSKVVGPAAVQWVRGGLDVPASCKTGLFELIMRTDSRGILGAGVGIREISGSSGRRRSGNVRDGRQGLLFKFAALELN